MTDFQIEVRLRSKKLALAVVQASQHAPRGIAADVLWRQLVRSATSIAANYRAATRGKSRPDCIAKLAIVEEEADETLLWIEMIDDASLAGENDLSAIADEVDQILRITVSSIKTMKRGLKGVSD